MKYSLLLLAVSCAFALAFADEAQSAADAFAAAPQSAAAAPMQQGAKPFIIGLALKGGFALGRGIAALIRRRRQRRRGVFSDSGSSLRQEARQALRKLGEASQRSQSKPFIAVSTAIAGGTLVAKGIRALVKWRRNRKKRGVFADTEINELRRKAAEAVEKLANRELKKASFGRNRIRKGVRKLANKLRKQRNSKPFIAVSTAIAGGMMAARGVRALVKWGRNRRKRGVFAARKFRNLAKRAKQMASRFKKRGVFGSKFRNAARKAVKRFKKRGVFGSKFRNAARKTVKRMKKRGVFGRRIRNVARAVKKLRKQRNSKPFIAVSTAIAGGMMAARGVRALVKWGRNRRKRGVFAARKFRNLAKRAKQMASQRMKKRGVFGGRRRGGRGRGGGRGKIVRHRNAKPFFAINGAIAAGQKVVRGVRKISKWVRNRRKRGVFAARRFKIRTRNTSRMRRGVFGSKKALRGKIRRAAGKAVKRMKKRGVFGRRIRNMARAVKRIKKRGVFGGRGRIGRGRGGGRFRGMKGKRGVF